MSETFVYDHIITIPKSQSIFYRDMRLMYDVSLAITLNLNSSIIQQTFVQNAKLILFNAERI